MSMLKQCEVRQPRLTPASLNNFYNKTVPCTNIWSQWCVTALIAQETETFHPFTTEQHKQWMEFLFALVWSVCSLTFTSSSHSDSPPGSQPVLQSPRHRRWTPAGGGQRGGGGGEAESGQPVHHCSEWEEGERRNEAEGSDRVGRVRKGREGEGGGRDLWVEGGEGERRRSKDREKSAERKTGKTDGNVHEVWHVSGWVPVLCSHWKRDKINSMQTNAPHYMPTVTICANYHCVALQEILIFYCIIAQCK